MFDETKCGDLNLDVSWKGAKYTFPRLFGDQNDRIKMMVVIFNNVLDSIDIRNENYEGYLMWGKTNCGNDFLRGLEDGRITYHIVDYTALYDYSMPPYFRSDKSLSASILQYKQTTSSDKGNFQLL